MADTRWCAWGWLGDHLALDFANTVRVEDGHTLELLNTPADLMRWLELEPAPLPKVHQVSLAELEEFRMVRDAACVVLHAAAAQHPLPIEAVEVINARIQLTGVSRLLGTAPGSSVHQPVGGVMEVRAMIGVCAAAVVDLVAREDLANLAVCHAPGCGQFFHRARPNQRWCSPGCGNRARVDRHRHRRQPQILETTPTSIPGTTSGMTRGGLPSARSGRG